MLRSLEPLEQKFREVEEELERRAFNEEEEIPESPTFEATPGPSYRHRRKGSVSISRFGLPSDMEDNSKSDPIAPSPLATVAHKSNFYHTLANPRSVESFISEGSEGSESHIEDEHHVTQMRRIAGRQSLSRTMGSILSRRIERSRSQNVLSSGGTSMVIGVSVEEATVDSTHPHHHDRRSTAFASPETAKSRPRASTLTIPVSNSPNSNWMSKAKEFTQRIRRKSNIGLPTEQP